MEANNNQKIMAFLTDKILLNWLIFSIFVLQTNLVLFMRDTIIYLYKITILQGKKRGCYYLGRRMSHLPFYIKSKDNVLDYILTHPDFDSYTGSGKYVREYFKTYDKVLGETYNKEILAFANSIDDARNLELWLVGDLHKTDPKCVNKIMGGGYNYAVIGTNNASFGVPKTQEMRDKISASLKKYYATHEQKWKGIITRTDEQKAQISKSLKEYYKTHISPNFGKRLGDKQKQILSAKQTAKWQDEEYRAKCVESMRKFHAEHIGFGAGREMPQSQRDNLSEILKGRSNKKNQGERNGMHGKVPHNARCVRQFTKDGRFIKEWASASLAMKTLGLKHIISVCLGKRKSAGGFIWKYGETDYTSASNAVLQYTLDGKLVTEYKSSHDASKQLGIDSSSIYKVCQGKCKTYKGFIWKFKTN